MNKKEIVIIGSYANQPYKLDLLNDCIDKIRPLGFDIMLVSHYPIPFEVQQKVDYVVYDKENILQDETSTTGYWFQCDEFNLVSYNNDGTGAHALAVVSNINNGVNYANYLKYKFFFYLECDNNFNVEDLKKIQVLKNSMFLKYKNMIVFNHLVQDCQIYETIMFGVPIPLPTPQGRRAQQLKTRPECWIRGLHEASTQGIEATSANLFRKECLGMQRSPKAMPLRPTNLDLPECDCHLPTMESAGRRSRPVGSFYTFTLY